MSGAFDPGQFRHRVRIERPAGSADGAGGQAEAWETVATVWAAVEPLRAAEKAAAGGLAGIVTHRVTLRWRDDITGGMRLVHGNRTLRVRAVHDPEERGHLLVALAEEERP